MDKDLTTFDRLVDAKIVSAVSRGNVIRVNFDNGMNSVIGLEYGGELFYHKDKENVSR